MNMYWQEDDESESGSIGDDVVDLVFSLRAKTLPVDHAYALSRAIIEQLPWFESEAMAGMHTIHVAASSNGWVRPEDILYPSRRTKFMLRVPRHRIEDAKQLNGVELDVQGHKLILDNPTTRLLSDITTLFSRYVVSDSDDEKQFVEVVVATLKAMGIKPKKLLCGTETPLLLEQGTLLTRSLMLADLSVEESVSLQTHGIGSHRHMGCGIFIPHKDIKRIREDQG